MFLDEYGKNGITAKLHKVRPGMIFVDLDKNKKANTLYSAYNRGASIIFTSKSILDPDLPVIKVKEVEKKYIDLLDDFYGHPFEKVNLISLIGSGSNYNVLRILEAIWQNSKYHALDSFFTPLEKEEKKELSRIEDIYRDVFNRDNLGARQLPIVFDINTSNFNFLCSFTYDCCIITDDIYEQTGKPEKDIIKCVEDIINRIPHHHPVIINEDVSSGLLSAGNNEKRVIINYGLGKNAMVTASSVYYDEASSFNYCLQKPFISKKGKLIESFETPIRMKTIGNNYIYNALAAITCALYYDIDMTYIQNAILSYEEKNKCFREIFSGDYKILDSCCYSPKDYAMVFEQIQTLSYEKLYILVALNPDMEIEYHEKIAEKICEWAQILNSHEVIITPGNGDGASKESAALKVLKIYNRILDENGINYRYYGTFKRSIVYIKKSIMTGDLFLIIRGSRLSVDILTAHENEAVLH